MQGCMEGEYGMVRLNAEDGTWAEAIQVGL
jgi:hypothetical protein